jgi:hypothetical protein
MLPGVNVIYTFTYFNYRLKQKIMNMIKNPQLHWSEQEASEGSNKPLRSTGGILADHSVKKKSPRSMKNGFGCRGKRGSGFCGSGLTHIFSTIPLKPSRGVR